MTTFDGTTGLIILDPGVTSISAAQLYSEWKRWVQSGAASYFPAFTNSIGGQGVSATESIDGYFFLRNDLGWRIRPHEADHELTIAGNLFGADPNAATFVQTLGGHTVMVRSVVSSRALVGSGSATLSASQFSDIADAVWSANLTAGSYSEDQAGGILRSAKRWAKNAFAGIMSK